jgi:hypothetical protein
MHNITVGQDMTPTIDILSVEKKRPCASCATIDRLVIRVSGA